MSLLSNAYLYHKKEHEATLKVLCSPANLTMHLFPDCFLTCEAEFPCITNVSLHITFHGNSFIWEFLQQSSKDVFRPSRVTSLPLPTAGSDIIKYKKGKTSSSYNLQKDFEKCYCIPELPSADLVWEIP